MRFVNKPKIAWITVNRNCNMRCEWCYAQASHYDISNSMSLNNIHNCIQIIKDLGIKKVILIGGEPTKYKYFFELLKICKDNDINVSLITNGLELSKIDFLNRLVEYGVKNINLSIKADNREKYIKFVGVDCYELIISAIKNILSKNINLTISYVITNDNVKTLYSLFSKLSNIGVRQFYMSFCNPFFDDNSINDYKIDIFELMNEFVLQCDKLISSNIKFNFHATLPLCMWPSEFIEKLVKFNRISTTCQLHNRSGIIFDPNLNIIPCNSLYQYPYAIFNKDFTNAETLIKYIYSNRVNSQFEKLLSAPSKKCINCSQFQICAGGCILQWFTYNFEDLERKKEEYYVRKIN